MFKKQGGFSRNISSNLSLLVPASWKLQLEFISHLLLFNNIMLIAFSEKHGGKTTYSNFLQQNLADSFNIHVTCCSKHYNENALMGELANHLNLSTGKELSFVKICDEVNKQTRHTLLILDDAHYLPKHKIKSFLNILKSQPPNPYFHLILVADYHLLPYLKQLNNEEGDDAIHSLDVGPFSHKEMKAYLFQNISDKDLIKFIDKNNCEKFYQSTQGKISKMNHDMIPFFTSIIDSRPKLTHRFKQLTTVAVVLLIGFFSVNIWHKLQITNFSWLPKLKIHQPLASEKDITPSNLTLLHQSYDSSHVFQSQIPKLTMHYSGEYSESYLTTINSSLFKLVITDKTNNETLPTIITQHENNTNFPKEIDSKVASIQFGVMKSKNITKQSKYTIQLVASHQLNSLKKLILQHPLPHLKMDTHTTIKDGRKWYILTAGRFKNWSDAHDVLLKLPPNYKPFQPWVKPIEKG